MGRHSLHISQLPVRMIVAVTEGSESGTESDSDDITFYRKVDARLGETPCKTPAKREAEYLYGTPAVTDTRRERGTATQNWTLAITDTGRRERGQATQIRTPAKTDMGRRNDAGAGKGWERDGDKENERERAVSTGRGRQNDINKSDGDGAVATGRGKERADKEAVRDDGVLEFIGRTDKVCATLRC